MNEGTIARLTDRGFGFISREGEEKDLFFHSNELENVEYNDLKEGDKVTFEGIPGEFEVLEDLGAMLRVRNLETGKRLSIGKENLISKSE